MAPRLKELYRQEVVPALMKEFGYGMPLEFWILAWAEGLVVRELPVRLIYNDPNRTFGEIEDAEKRLAYYLDVIERTEGRVRCAYASACPYNCLAGAPCGE